MPTISIDRDQLYRRLLKSYTEDEFQDLCFSFGIELDEVVWEKEADSKTERCIYKIEVPANRYDLLCFEGLGRSLAIFLQLEPIPTFKIIEDKSFEKTAKMFVRKSTNKIRPCVAAAILRNITFDRYSYANFIDLQDKLHQNLGRKRSLVAIGTHDLDTIQGPFVYEALKPDEIVFRPLNENREFTAHELMTYYESHTQLKHYLPIIKDLPLYPVIKDVNGVVLSLPPIINSEHSKISLHTRNVFIECTGTDSNRVSTALTILVTMFSEYCNPKYEIQMCKVKKKISHTKSVSSVETKFPKFVLNTQNIAINQINELIGVDLNANEAEVLLRKMSLIASKSTSSPNQLTVQVPPYRCDILHKCDIIEDIAIAYGYNNIEAKFPKVLQIAQQVPLNRFTDILRETVVQAGFIEVLTFSLCSRDDIGPKLNTNIYNASAVHIGNPKTLEFQVVRPTLLPGLLKSIASNKMQPLPIRIFEISDIVTKIDNLKFNVATYLNKMGIETGAANRRHLAAMYCSKEGNFEIVHGLLDRIMLVLETKWRQAAEARSIANRSDRGYYLRKSDANEQFLPKRCAEIRFSRGDGFEDQTIGFIGTLHPKVLSSFEIPFPSSYFEFDLEVFDDIYC